MANHALQMGGFVAPADETLLENNEIEVMTEDLSSIFHWTFSRHGRW